MKEPTMEEVLKLVGFYRDGEGKLKVYRVFSDVKFDIEGSIGGSVFGSVNGTIYGTINGRKWQHIETPKEKAIRLIREGKSAEALKVLEESE